MRRLLALAALALIALVVLASVFDFVPGTEWNTAAPGAATAPLRVESRASQPIERAAATMPATRATMPGDITTIRVVDGATKQPVEGAEVRIFAFDWDSLSAEQQATFTKEQDEEAMVERFGTCAVTDARGEAILPRARLAGFVTARKASLYGMLYLHDGSSTAATVELEPDTSVTVQVLDASGAPQGGVPVGLFGWSVGKLEPRVRNLRASDEHGLARFRHLQCSMRNLLRPGDPPAHAVAQLVLAGATPPPSTPFAVNAPPADPVVLRMPATGRLVVELRDAGGALISVDNAAVGLGTGGDPQGTHWEIAERGRASFAHVALGQRFEISARMAIGELGKQQHAGPERAGEERVVTFAIGNDYPVVTGRALDEARRPLARRKLTLRARGAPDTPTIETDAEGSFRVVLPRALANTTLPALSLWHRGPPTLCARIETPLAIQKGEIALGDMLFTEPPLVVGVEIVTHDGAPAPRASVEIRSSAGEQLPPESRDVLEISTGDGRREIRGFVDRDARVLRVTAPEHEPVSLPFELGARDLRVVLGGGAAFTVEVLLHPVTYAVFGELRRSGEGDVIRRLSLVQRGSTLLTWQSLAPGSYDLALRIREDPDPVATRTAILVQETPRLTIDLREALAKFRIVAIDAEGATIARAGSLRIRPLAGDRFGWSRFEQGVADLVSIKPRLDLILNVKGCRTTRAEAAPGETRVRCLPGHRVRVSCPGLSGERAIGLWREDAGEPPKTVDESFGWNLVHAVVGERAGATSEYTFSVPEPGVYRVVFATPQAEPARITIVDRDDEQTFSVKVR